MVAAIFMKVLNVTFFILLLLEDIGEWADADGMNLRGWDTQFFLMFTSLYIFFFLFQCKAKMWLFVLKCKVEKCILMTYMGVGFRILDI